MNEDEFKDLLRKQVEDILDKEEDYESYKNAVLKGDWKKAHDILGYLLMKQVKESKETVDEIVEEIALRRSEIEQSCQREKLSRQTQREEETKKVEELLQVSNNLIEKLRSGEYIIQKRRKNGKG